MSVQLQIRADIEYLASSWKTPKVYPINGDISKDKAFAKLPVLLSYIKPEESKQAPQGNGKIQKWRIELFLAYVKLPDGCDPTTKSHEYDEQVSEMSELLDKLHTGLTKQYINGVKNPIANARGYIADQPLTFLETYFEFGSNKYMAVRATWSMTVNVANCFDCTDFVSGTFDPVNVPPNDSNPIGGGNGQKGDMLYWSDTLNKWIRFNIGPDGTVLKVVAGLPSWEDETGGGITEETDPIFEAWESANGANLINHLSDTNNPHDVTKNQLGLGNVDNTSDTDKPVSTLQAAADTAVLNAAASDATSKANAAETSAKNYADAQDITTLNSAKSYAESLVVGLVDDRGNYNASSNLFPSTGGSGTAGAILKGDLWTVSVAGTLGGNEVTSGDFVRALIDTPGQTSSNWAVTENNIGYVAENASNKTDTMAGNTASSVKYLSTKGVYDWVISLGYITTAALSGYLTSATAALTYQAILTAANFGSFINGLTAKTTPVDADGIALMDSAASNTAKFLSWANLKATLKTYFDTLYVATSDINVVGMSTDQSVAVTGNTNITQVASIHVPGGTYKNGDGFTYESFASKSAQTANDTWQIYLYVNTTNSLTGATNICIVGSYSSSTRFGSLERLAGYFSGGNLYGYAVSSSAASDVIFSSTAVLANLATLNIANDFYLIVALRHNGSSTADTLTHIKTVLYKQKS